MPLPLVVAAPLAKAGMAAAKAGAAVGKAAAVGGKAVGSAAKTAGKDVVQKVGTKAGREALRKSARSQAVKKLTEGGEFETPSDLASTLTAGNVPTDSGLVELVEAQNRSRWIG